MKEILLARLAAVAIAAAVVAACAMLEEQAPALDTAATAATQTGACLRVACDFPPIGNCRVRPGRCHR